MATPYACAASEIHSPRALGSTGELRPGLGHAPRKPGPFPITAASTSVLHWGVAVALAIGAAALRSLG